MWSRPIDTWLVQTCCAFALTILLAPTTQARNAQPDIMVASRLQTGSPYQMIICGRSGTFDLNVNARTGTMIEVPGGIVNRAWPESPGFDFHDDEVNNKVYFTPRATTPPGTETSIRFWLASGQEATIHASVVEHTMGIEDNVLLYHQSEREKLGLAHEPNPCEPRPDRTMARLIARATERHAHEPIMQALPVVEHVARSGHALDVSMLVAEWEGHDMVVDFLAHNPDFQPSRLTGIEVFDEHGSRLDARLLAPRADQVATSEKATELAIVNGHGSMTGSILLSGILSRDVGQMELRFRGFKGASPYFTSVKVARFRLITEEEEEREARAKEREARAKEREARAKQIAVSARVLGGGYWMGTGDPAIVRGIEGTAMAGLGLRLSKGLASLLAFEGELVGARSGEVTFSNVTWDGMTGDATRQASFGRLQGAGVIRFGQNYLTSMRLGVGLQVTNVTSTMVAGGSSVDGPGDGFEVDGFFAAGLGFDARLGEHWLLGAGMAFANTFNTGARSLEVGLHAGYRWSLEGEDGSLIER